ncbi:protein phosphatase 1 regulatory subunit 3A isoform X2 [Labrus mixtus]|uniref:protein phosphatase 1 regulatory subunit 3A isoform X2 n=1 Tax=Labrus mixtus TaxID=508554 RepID=UPI0029C0F955|nr:protein phosphatase 1 regulatory subunit 3A isoform X2 [Labrus mixtus]
MESAEQLSPCGACNLLGVPGLISVDVDDDDDECDIVIGIRPKSSPLPRRKSSLSDEDSEPGPPLCGSRRVSFADAKGLSLVQVKEFGIWDVPKLPEYDSSEGKDKVSVEYIISPLNFSLPLSREVLFDKVRDQKLELESIQLLPGTTILKGVIRVLNISFDKAVYVRTSLDSWSSHFDLLTEYMPGSSEGLTDCFSFKLTLIPPFGEQGAGVDFCLRYETSVGTFWANNDNRNYMLCCHQRAKELREQTQKENVKKKSCLKSVGQNFSTLENNPAMETSLPESDKTDVSKQGQEVDTIQAKQISDAQSGTSEEDGENILVSVPRADGTAAEGAAERQRGWLGYRTTLLNEMEQVMLKEMIHLQKQNRQLKRKSTRMCRRSPREAAPQKVHSCSLTPWEHAANLSLMFNRIQHQHTTTPQTARQRNLRASIWLTRPH